MAYTYKRAGAYYGVTLPNLTDPPDVPGDLKSFMDSPGMAGIRIGSFFRKANLSETIGQVAPNAAKRLGYIDFNHTASTPWQVANVFGTAGFSHLGLCAGWLSIRDSGGTTEYSAQRFWSDSNGGEMHLSTFATIQYDTSNWTRAEVWIANDAGSAGNINVMSGWIEGFASHIYS